jgi:type II secretory ATPase GspE/PulE/Tfp pilus assembly ATPase PilB-like protein
MLEHPHGLLLATGPTGSGKTTTLYSALNQLRTPEKNIVTIEDPVEYQLAMINQVQVNEAIDLRFSTVLRSVLRQDPNIIMLGEIRDAETAETAVQAALTGHLVLSTLHTNDSIGAIARLVNLKVEPFLLASALIGVIAQRLVRRICPQCKAPDEPPAELRSRLALDQDKTEFQRGKGCKHCFTSGYRGRVGLYEIFEISPEARGLLEKNAAPEILRQYRQRVGETTLFEEAIMAAQAGQTSLTEVLRVAGAAHAQE